MLSLVLKIGSQPKFPSFLLTYRPTEINRMKHRLKGIGSNHNCVTGIKVYYSASQITSARKRVIISKGCDSIKVFPKGHYSEICNHTCSQNFANCQEYEVMFSMNFQRYAEGSSTWNKESTYQVTRLWYRSPFYFSPLASSYLLFS